MADALCGPSNPLQNIQKHSSVDRSLQHDRLTSRSNAPQGFRSNQNHNAGLLDPEFEAFKASGSPAFTEAQQLYPHPPHHFLPQPHAQASARTPANLAWATDFQQLSISSSPTTSIPPQHQRQQQQPQQNWHQEFQYNQTPAFSHAPQSHYPVMPDFSHNQPAYQPYHEAPTYNQAQSLDKGKGRQQDDTFDAAAFEIEFQAHAQDLETTTNHLHPAYDDQNITSVNAHGMDSTQEKLNAVNDGAATIYKNYKDMQAQDEINATARAASHEDNSIRQAEINAAQFEADHQRAHHHPEEQQQQQQPQFNANDDELAATAGELLSRVKDNTSQKFKDSTFLAFMGQIRDREVKVEGNKFVSIDDANSSVNPVPSSTDAYMTGALAPEETKTESVKSRNSGARTDGPNDLLSMIFPSGITWGRDIVPACRKEGGSKQKRSRRRKRTSKIGGGGSTRV